MGTNSSRTVVGRTINTVVVLAVLFSVSAAAYAAAPGPFVGQWQAVDVDGSDMHLTIGGRLGGPFQMTWTDDYISFCGGEAGIVRGTGWLNEQDANLLEADLHLVCFRSGDTLDFHVTFRYHPLTNTLSIWYLSDPFGQVTIWHQAGRPQEEPPELLLRVNYGHDWVESFYEAGHVAWVTVTDRDGNLKATTELVTEPKDDFDGKPGFQTLDSIWYDPEGNPMDNPPDIQPHDWVFGWVDNGASAQVQIGDIGGTIDLEADSIEGTIYAPWFIDEVKVECHPWGAPEPQPEMRFDATLPNGDNMYFCSWAEEWDIQPRQDVGVGYFGPDGHWVANAFFVPNPRFTVFPEWEWFDGMDWPDGANVSISVTGNEECSLTMESWGGFFNGGFPEGCDVAVGDLVTFKDGTTIRTHTVRNLAITNVDKIENTVAGEADPEAVVHVWVHETEGVLKPTAGEDGTWLVDFDDNGLDLVENMGGRAQIYDDIGNATAVDWHIPNPHFSVFPEWELVEGWEWPLDAVVHLAIDDPGTEESPDHGQDETVVLAPWDPNQTWVTFNFAGMYDAKLGDVVTLDDGTTIRTHTVENLAVTAVDEDADTVSGTADAYAEVNVWPHATGEQVVTTADDEGAWQVDFTDMYDLGPGDGGRAEIRDGMGNGTAVDWYIPNPHFSVFPEWEFVEGWEWPLDALVHMTIDHPATEQSPDYWQDETVVVAPWDPNTFWVSFSFAGMYDAKLGDVVTLDDGTTIRTHTVENLAVTAVDEDADTVSGTADAYAEVYVWPHATGEQLMTTAGGDGTWQVDFSGMFDLVPFECGRAEIRDLAYNGTAVDWCAVPPARILVQITDNWFLGQYFAPYAEQTFWLYESPGGTELMNGTMQADYQGTAFAWVDDPLDLAPGNYLVVSDGVTTKDLVLEELTFDVFDPTRGFLQGTAPLPAGRTVWVGIGWEDVAWTMEVSTDFDGDWIADFAMLVPDDYQWVAAQVFDPEGDVSEVRPSPRWLSAGNFHVAWSQTNPEEVIYLSWSGSGNLTNVWAHSPCLDDLEFFGNSWVTENEGEPTFFFQSLVGWGTTGAWSQNGPTIDIGSESSGCPGSTGIPIHTTYQFFDDEVRANLIAVQRVFEFGDSPYPHDVRPFIPRLYPADGFTQVLHPDASGLGLVTRTTDDCGFGCRVEEWNGTWFAIHDPATGTGMIVQHAPSDYPVALWVDYDGGSLTNSSSVLLLQPDGGFVGAVTETEYLCFYDSSWDPSLTLPPGCQP